MERKNGFNEGYGIRYYPNGNRYEGEWKNGFNEGYGIMYFSNGNRCERELNFDLEGCGIYYFSNGNRYEGELNFGLSDGYGIFYFLNGDRYEGKWKNGINEGYGIFYSSFGWKVKRYFRYNTKNKLLFFIYQIILFLYNLYLSVLRNKMTLLFIIILIIGILIK